MTKESIPYLENDSSWIVFESADARMGDCSSAQVEGLAAKKRLAGKQKNQMFYAHTYRRFDQDAKRQVPYLLALVLPVVLLVLLSYSWLSNICSELVVSILSNGAGMDGLLGITSTKFLPVFGDVFFVTAPTKLPSTSFILLNLATMLVLLILFGASKRKFGMPFSVYFAFAFIIQTSSCIFFLFAQAAFPYDCSSYSMLYMEQEVGIWISFAVIAGLITGLISFGGLLRRALVFALIMGYSFTYGLVRYAVFLYIVANFSSLYMAALFFMLGPFFDFLYLVFVYSVFINGSINRISSRSGGEGVWRWA